MTKSEKEWWELKRAKGYNHYLLRQGVLKMGLCYGALMTLGKVALSLYEQNPVQSLWEIAMRFCFYSLFFGALMGMITWRSNEKDYQAPTEVDDAS